MTNEVYINAESPLCVLDAVVDHVKNYSAITDEQRAAELELLEQQRPNARHEAIRRAILERHYTQVVPATRGLSRFESVGMELPGREYSLPGLDREADHRLIEQHREKLKAAHGRAK